MDDGKTWNNGTGYNPDYHKKRDSLIGLEVAKLLAWDPINQKEVWNVRQSAAWNGGVVSTGELVFQGTGTGNINAYDAVNGKQLYTFPLQTGIVAPPITYMVIGVQYLPIVAGWGGGQATWKRFTKHLNQGGIYTFKIGGKENKPDFPAKSPRELVSLEFDASAEQLDQGRQLFERFCGKCHWGDGEISHLTFSRPEIFNAFYQIVGEGAFLYKGMPSFKDRMSQKDVSDVKVYILSIAKDSREKLKNSSMK